MNAISRTSTFKFVCKYVVLMSVAPDGELALEIDGSITRDDLRTRRVYWHSPTLTFGLSIFYPTPGELLVEKFDVARARARKDED